MKNSVKELPPRTTRQVGLTEVTVKNKTYEVSTVRLGSNGNQTDDAIALFASMLGGLATDGYETMIFDRKSDRPSADLYARHYDVREQAEAGHKDVVAKLLAGKIALDRDREEPYDKPVADC
jgi:hypothetical protein